MVDDARAVDDLVPAVAVEVACRDAVIPLAAVRAVPGRPIVAVERPDARELPVAEVPGGEDRARVVAAREDEARALTIEIRDRREKAIDPISVVVSPTRDLAARRT